MSTNPLASPQREKDGSTTFAKYEYQYHWALCRIIDEQRKAHDFALFMELHEDVVLANSLDSSVAKFEFNQVKNITSPKYNIKNLTKRSNGKASVLGKLISSATDKPYASRLSTLNLVASCGFKINLAEEGLKLEVTTLNDISDESKDDLLSSLSEELGITELPENLQFVVSKLNIDEQQDIVVGKISALISDAYPASHCNSVNIYRALIDDLHRKGVITYDYKKWQELLDKKALTSKSVKEVIENHVSLQHQDLQSIFEELKAISLELNLTYFEARKLRNKIRQIHLQILGFPSSQLLKTRKIISTALESSHSKDLKSTINNAISLISEKDKNQIGSGSNEDVLANIIYEIIMEEL